MRHELAFLSTHVRVRRFSFENAVVGYIPIDKNLDFGAESGYSLLLLCHFLTRAIACAARCVRF